MWKTCYYQELLLYVLRRWIGITKTNSFFIYSTYLTRVSLGLDDYHGRCEFPDMCNPSFPPSVSHHKSSPKLPRGRAHLPHPPPIIKVNRALGTVYGKPSGILERTVALVRVSYSRSTFHHQTAHIRAAEQSRGALVDGFSIPLISRTE